MVSKKVLKPSKYTPIGVLAVDVNEKYIVVGNRSFEHWFETAVERALHYKELAEKLQGKYSSARYNAWLRRSGIRERIKSFHEKARNIIEDWLRRPPAKIMVLAKQGQLP